MIGSLLLRDHFLEFLMVKHLKDQTSNDACTVLNLKDCHVSLSVTMDFAFTSLEFAEFCARLDIVHIRVSPCQHQVNGTADRMIETVKAFMRKARSPDGLSIALLNYRSTSLDAKIPVPRVLLNNCPFRITLPCISLVHPSNETCEILDDRKASMARQFNS